MSSLWPTNDARSGPFSIEDFLESPLVCWAKVVAGREEDTLTLSDLSNVDFLKDLVAEIDSQLLVDDTRWLDNPVLRRSAILENITIHLRAYFLDVLGHITIMRPPDIIFLSQFPGTDYGGQELQKLFLLLLSYAVQGHQKEQAVERIQEMEEDQQKGIVDCIRKVTESPSRVWRVEAFDTADVDNFRQVLLTAQQHIKTLVEDREELIKLALSLWRENYKLTTSGEAVKRGLPPSGHTHAAETADLKAQIRKLSQGLYEVEEELRETRDELTTSVSALQALQKENHNLVKEAALTKVYRDELDAMNEKEKRVDRLESELSRCRNQLLEMEYCKNRIDEMQQNYLLLAETKALLESQLDSARKKLEMLPLLENELALVKSDLNEAILECNMQREQARQLVVQKTSLSLELQRLQSGCDAEPDEQQSTNLSKSVSLSDQLHESLSAKILRLEIENEKLRTVVNSRQSEERPTTFIRKSSSGIGGEDSDNQDRSSSASDSSTVDHVAQSEDYGYGTVTSQISDGSMLDGEEYGAFVLPVTGSLLSHEVSKHSTAGNETFYEDQYTGLISEIASLRKSVDHYRQFEIKWNDSRSEEVRLREDIESSIEKTRNLEQYVRKLESDLLGFTATADDLVMVKADNESMEASVKSLDHRLKLSERENKRLSAALENQTAKSSAIQICAAELEQNLAASSQENGKSTELRLQLAALKGANDQLNLQLSSTKDQNDNLRDDLKLKKDAQQRVKSQLVVILSTEGICVPIGDQVDNLDHLVTCVIEGIGAKHRLEMEALRSECEALRRARTSSARSMSIESTCSSDFSILEQARDEVASLQRDLRTARDECLTADNRLRAMSTTYESVQVEHKKFQSRIARMEAENRELKSNNADLTRRLDVSEKEKDGLLRNTEESQQMHSTLMSDHESLQKFHEQLNVDYDKVIGELQRLRSDHRKTTQELETVRQKLRSVELEPAPGQMTIEPARVERLQNLEKEYKKLVAENERLQSTQRQLSETHRVLTEEHKTVRTEVNHLKLQKIEYEGVVNDCRTQIQSKEYESGRHTEILLGIIASLEEEKRSFASAIERLVLQYDDVFLHSWKEKNQMQSEHKELQEKLHALDLQKQLLIQKLYDTFKVNDVRKRNISFLKRVRRAAGELVGRSRSRSRNRAISPTDSTADSSSVESGNGGGGSSKFGKPLHSTVSVHSLASYKIDPNDTRSGPQLSYSSDDLRKSSSASASSCISPSEQATKELPEKQDPAFHRVGSRRGVYQPPIIHHPAMKATTKFSTPAANKEPPTTRTRSDSNSSSKPGTKKCCGSYGGYHDCAMLSLTRLTDPVGSITSPNTRSGSRTSSHTTDGAMVKSRSTNFSPRSSVADNQLTPIAERRASAPRAEVSTKGYVLKPKSAGSNLGDHSPSPSTAALSDSGSTFSFPSTQTLSSSLRPESSVSSYSYYRSDNMNRSVSETPTRSLNGAVENEPAVWYEYGCV